MATKPQYGLGKGLGALLGGEDLSQLRKPVGYINKAVVSTEGKPQDTSDVLRIPVDMIEPNPYQPRMSFDNEALRELADSIRTFGLIQPITVRRKGDGKYQIISGERRFRACTKAGMDMIPAYIRDANDQGAMTHDGMENASMEFDVDKHCPTYRLFIGIPGKSNAFEISRRLGISESIIESARAFIKKEDTDFESILSDAERTKRRAEEEMELAEQARAEHDRLVNELKAEKEKFEQEKAVLRQKAREEAKKIVLDTRREMEQLIVKIRSIKSIDQREADRVIQQTRDALRKSESELFDEIQYKTANGKPPKSVNPGDRVTVVSVDKEATVLAKPDRNGEVQVQIGIIKMSVPLNDIRVLGGKQAANVNVKVEYNPANTVGLELDIRGKLVDEAMPIVDKYLCDAHLNGLSEVNIIHGKGTGALRAGIQAYLKNHPRVKSFRNGNYGEGDYGVTVVTLK